jgi:TetR/AcrR family transcriptional regulator, transcriptional repressor for nem operon
VRMSAEAKDQSRARILAAAGRMFRERGIEGASLGDIMRTAGLTHGGFYRHFDGKDDLLSAALSQTFAEFAAPLLDAPAAETAQRFRTRYLSPEHVASPGAGCPAAALGPEVARAAPRVRAEFTKGLEQMVQGLARDGSPGARREALASLSLMVGAVVLARAVDNGLAEEILSACAPTRST